MPVFLSLEQGNQPLYDSFLPSGLEEYWYWASSGRFVPRFYLGEGILWDASHPLIPPVKLEDLTPVIQLLRERERRSGTQAFVLLFPYGSLQGGGFFIPPEFLSPKGSSPLYIMGADRPQVILHEIGHALGLKDQYHPGETNLRPFTLMGWSEDLIPPLDPIARSFLGWTRVKEILPGAKTTELILAPEEVVRVYARWGGSLWFGFQPLVNLGGIEGWMLELDYLPTNATWQRVQMSLTGPKERKEGTFTLANPAGSYRFQWTFLPTPPRVHLLVQAKGAQEEGGFACSLVLSRKEDPSRFGEGDAGGVLLMFLLWLGASLLRYEGKRRNEST